MDEQEDVAQSAANALGVRAIKNSREINLRAQARYHYSLNGLAFERLERAKARLAKRLGGSSYFKRHARSEALDVIGEQVERFQGFPKDDEDYQQINTAVFWCALNTLELAIEFFAPEAHEQLGYGEMLEVIKLAQHYLVTINTDLSVRLAKAHTWAVEPL